MSEYLARYAEIVSAVGTQTSRTVGIEMEGHYNTYFGDKYEFTPPCNAVSKGDGSLGGEFGIEINSDKLTDLDSIRELYAWMQGIDFRYTRSAGTHVHVDVTDLTRAQIMRLAWFCAMVEPIYHAMVRDYRWKNGYVGNFEHWEKLFNTIQFPEDWETTKWFDGDDGTWWNVFDKFVHSNPDHQPIFYWAWMVPRHYGTTEWRLFSWIESADEAIAFMLLAHHSVEMVKNSTLDQLKMIVDQIWQSSTVEETVEKLCAAVGLPTYPIRGERVLAEIESKLETIRQVAAG